MRRKEPAVSSFSHSSYRFTHLGMDVHKDSISVGILPPDRESPEVDKIVHDEPMVRRLVGRLVDQIGDPRLLRACYEAGPTGYGLHRLLESMGVRCDVIAPALIPRAPGDRVKTDKRDCRRLARLHRMGELVAIRVPSEAEEGVRDLCRARGDLIEDRRRARQRLSAFLLRHGVVWRDGSAWTIKHLEWLGSRRFTDRAVQATYERYLATATVREADVDAIEADLLPWFDAELFHDRCSRLACYRGIDRIGALTLVSEVCDWRRFESAHRHMAFVGLVPSEYSSGERTFRGHLTKAGNVHVRRQLVESAWAYQYPANVTRQITRRQEGAHPDTVTRAWQAQLRLCRRFRLLAARKDSRNVVAAAVARELAGFVWAEMTA
jgi:transposase